VATSRSGLLRFLVGFEPAVSTDTEDFDAELELLGVQGLPPGLGAWPECPACGVPGVQEAPEPVPGPETLQGLLAIGGGLGEPMERLCWACTAKEEVAQVGVRELLFPKGLPTDPDGPATLIVVGRLRWDCFRDYWVGHDECDVEFELEAFPE